MFFIKDFNHIECKEKLELQDISEKKVPEIKCSENTDTTVFIGYSSMGNIICHQLVIKFTKYSTFYMVT